VKGALVGAERALAKGALLAALGFAGLLVATPAVAQVPAGVAPVEPSGGAAPQRLVEVRFALSSSAAKQLSEPRLRRLLEIELADAALLAPGAAGPLGDHVAYIWVDLAEPSTVAIEVRVGARTVERRELADAELTGDVAVRVIAIIAAEMVRAQMQPVKPPKKPPAPKPPSPEEIEAASRQVDALSWSPRVGAAFVPSAGATLFGPGFDLGARRFGVSAHLLADLFVGPTSFGSARWFEVGLGAGYRMWVTPSLRFAGQLSASAAAVRVDGGRLLGEGAGQADTWSARAGGTVAVEWRVAEPMWLTLGVSPSAVLRPFEVLGAGGARSAFDGVLVGGALGILFEQRAPVHVKALQSNGAGVANGASSANGGP
jgi:hypothetical protein